MKQIERLIARLVQLVEDHPGVVFTIIVAVDENGVPLCWQVQEGRAEGLQRDAKPLIIDDK